MFKTMNTVNIEEIKKLGIELNEQQEKMFDCYCRLFLEENSKLNLISKNDEKFLFEKHIYDSLSINKFIKPKNNETLLDIGTGGGFPSVPIAILFSELKVYALDSIKKKINSIERIKNELNIKNLFPICDRAENIVQKFDYVTSRAVASLDLILKYAVPRLNEGGYFIAYKSKKAIEEINQAQKTIKKTNTKVVDVIEYALPLEELFERNLIIFSKK